MSPPVQSSSSDPVAEVTDLTKRYGTTTAVDGVSFQIRPGTVTGFLGPNGAGKTTTLRLLLGLAAPTSGSATIAGCPFAQLDQPWRHVGAVLESDDFHLARNGRDHLRVLARLCGLDDNRVDRMLEEVDLQAVARRRVGGYSLGMRQRLGLAGALLGAPSLLVLDEPANGLDPEGVRWLRSTLRRFADDGGAVVMSSHLLAEAQHTVDHVLVIVGGRLVADCSLGELTGGGGDLEAAYLAAIDPAAAASDRTTGARR